MESYSRTSSATAATLTFLEAWTSKLHALGYVSGVYSSSASGIADLAARIGSGYLQPDDLWIANWNGQQSTADPVVPASAWAQHQRIHQYRGGHDETYGGVTINIDNNYVDGATVGDATPADQPRRPGRLARPGRRAGAGPGAGARLGLRPRRADRDARHPRLRRRSRRRQRSASAYDLGPIANQPRNDVAAEYPEAGSVPRLRRLLLRRHQAGAAADLRLRRQHRPRQRPPARLQGEADPGRDHAPAHPHDQARGPGAGRLRMAGRDRMPGPAAAAHPVQEARWAGATAASASTPSPATSAAAASTSAANAATASSSPSAAAARRCCASAGSCGPT